LWVTKTKLTRGGHTRSPHRADGGHGGLRRANDVVTWGVHVDAIPVIAEVGPHVGAVRRPHGQGRAFRRGRVAASVGVAIPGRDDHDHARRDCRRHSFIEIGVDIAPKAHVDDAFLSVAVEGGVGAVIHDVVYPGYYAGEGGESRRVQDLD
jgi:hypothetical protein